MDIDLLARSGGMKILLHVLGEGPHELQPLVASAFLYIVDSPRTRVYLSVGTDLEVSQLFHVFHSNLNTPQMALSAITDAYGKPQDHREKIKACSKIVQLMLRTWSGGCNQIDSGALRLIHFSGLMYFCLDDMRAIRSLVDTLRIPSLDTRVISFDCLAPSLLDL